MLGGADAATKTSASKSWYCAPMICYSVPMICTRGDACWQHGMHGPRGPVLATPPAMRGRVPERANEAKIINKMATNARFFHEPRSETKNTLNGINTDIARAFLQPVEIVSRYNRQPPSKILARSVRRCCGFASRR
jgi:hypothetical protein